MNDIENVTVDIPTDEDGYVILKCEHCGTIFKINASDYEDDRFLHIYCPLCGFTSENYMPDSILNFIKAKASNLIQERVNAVLDDCLTLKNDLLRIEISNNESNEYVESLGIYVYGMEKAYFNCCQRYAKIKTLLKITGCYCPFCGVKNYEID